MVGSIAERPRFVNKLFPRPKKSEGSRGDAESWTLLDSKFQQLRFENLAAQGAAQRQIEERPATIKRSIIMNVTGSGNADCSFRIDGTGFRPKR